MPIKIGHITDPHVTSGVRLAMSSLALTQAAKIFEDNQVDLIALTGDLSGRDAPHRMTTAERDVLATAIGSFGDIAPVIIVRGNHDAKGELNIFTKLKSKFPIRAYEGMARIGWKDLDRQLHIDILPWMPIRSLGADFAKENLEEANKKIISNIIGPALNQPMGGTPGVLLSHLPVLGAQMKEFVLNSVRDIWLTPEFLDSLPHSYIGIGHIHERQQISDRGFYTGTPFPIDYSETGPKGISTINIDTDTHKATVTFEKLDSWKMLKVELAWEDGKWAKNDLVGMNREHIEDAFVKMLITLPDKTPITDVDIGPWLTKILTCGGYIDEGNMRYIRSGTVHDFTGFTFSRGLVVPLKDRIRKRLTEVGEEEVDEHIALLEEVQADESNE